MLGTLRRWRERRELVAAVRRLRQDAAVAEDAVRQLAALVAASSPPDSASHQSLTKSLDLARRRYHLRRSVLSTLETVDNVHGLAP